MAYYNGSVSSIADLRAALLSACVDAGWVWNASTEVLSKADLHVRLVVTATELQITGRTSAGSGDTPNMVAIGRLCASAGFPNYDFTWPAEYHAFTFTDTDEIYLLVRYSVDLFQWCAFGMSAIEAMPGSGMWLGATRGASLCLHQGSQKIARINSADGGYGMASGYSSISPGLFWTTGAQNHASNTQDRNGFVHSDFEGQGWLLGQTTTGALTGVKSITELLNTQPSAWNSEAALIPIRAWKTRLSARLSLVAELRHARHIRIDNYEPGQVVSLGTDKWMVFPWLRKDVAARDGGAGSVTVDHSGTFGWAIRYEGP